MRVALGEQRARVFVVCSLGVYFALLAALGGYARWGRLGPSSSNVWWGDLRSVTSAWDCTRRGLPVLPVNSCDPWQRPANYPRLWLLPSHLGMGQGSTMTLGFVVAALFLVAAVAVVPAKAGLGLGAVYALVLCSPAAMLGVERGNVDLTLFALVALAVLVSRRGTGGLVVSSASLLLAAMLKLFPFVATGFLLRRGERPRVWAAAAVTALFALYVLVLHHQMRAVVSAVPQDDLTSFGVRRVSEWLSVGANEWVTSRLTSWRAWDVVIVAVVAAAGVLIGRRLGKDGEADDRDLDLFWAGACTYVCSYAIARNYDYRLVFLLLCVPQLVQWARAGSRFAIATLLALFLATWFDIWTRPPYLDVPLRWWDHATEIGPDAHALPLSVVGQLVLFGTLVAWLAATASSWRRST